MSYPWSKLVLIGAFVCASTAWANDIIDRSRLHYSQWNQELESISEPQFFDQCSHHSPQQEMRVGLSVLGTYGLEIKTKTYYGTCTSYEVFDLETGAFANIAPYGPDCSGRSVLRPLPTFMESGDSGYDDKLDALKDTIVRLRDGYACHEPRPYLGNLVDYLNYVQGYRQNLLDTKATLP